MKKIVLFLLMVSGVAIWACNKTTTLPSYTASTAFTVTSSMKHSKDSIRNSGDTVVFTISGTIADTTGKYAISATLKQNDTTGAANAINALFFKKVVPTYTSTANSSGLFPWTATVSLPIPSVASKTGIKTTATFAYGLNASSELGNLVATDSKYIYVK